MTDASGTLELWILRHAKAAENGPDGDITRPLTKNGRRQAELVRDHLESLSAGDLPTFVLCSPGVRARETAELVMPALPDAVVEFAEGLYSKDADGVIDLIREIYTDARRVMVVGHNPTLLELCIILAEPKFTAALEEKGLPIAGLVRLAQPGVSEWDQLAVGSCEVVERFRPKL